MLKILVRQKRIEYEYLNLVALIKNKNELTKTLLAATDVEVYHSKFLWSTTRCLTAGQSQQLEN